MRCFAHSMHVFQAATCIQHKHLFGMYIGFANVNVFWASVFYKNGHKSRIFWSYEHRNRCKLKPAISPFILIFFTSIGYVDQKLWCFMRDTSHSIKNHFYVFFQNAHHCNLRKNVVFKNFWGFVSEYVRTITNVCVLLKVGFCLGAV